MLRVAVVLAVVAVAVGQAMIPGQALPPRAAWCNSLACPRFVTELDVKKEARLDNLDMSVRRYVTNMTWVGTSEIKQANMMSWWSMVWSEQTMFNKLFRYIDGNNANGAKIPMTAPVLVKTEPAGVGMYRVSMMFYVDRMAPKPKDADVWVYKMDKDFTVAVRQFKTWFVTLPWSWQPQQQALRKELDEAVTKRPDLIKCFNRDTWYYVSYDKPWVWGSRMNEIFMEPKC